MKSETASVVVEARLLLSQRELAILNHICSYAMDSKDFAAARQSSTYNGGVSEQEIKDFVSSMRAVTSGMMAKIECDAAVMFKTYGGKA